MSIPFSFLHSALSLQSPIDESLDVLDWLEERRTHHSFNVDLISFSNLDQWTFEEKSGDMVHRSGKFFRIEGLRIHPDVGNSNHWDQPIINQPEIGILGVLTKTFHGVRHFLMQAKMEPGNIGFVQLSPTVQVTQSNYTRAHQGQLPAYLEYFINPSPENIIMDQLQTERGNHCLAKRNRNMIVEATGDIPLRGDFRWLTLGQIKKLMGRSNLVNMCSRSILAGVSFEITNFERDTASLGLSLFGRDLINSSLEKTNLMHQKEEIISWIAARKLESRLKREYLPLKELRGWTKTKDSIFHNSKQLFSVIAVSVVAESREVTHWTQPMLRSDRIGISGLISKKIKGILHFLIQAKVVPGAFDIIELGPTQFATEGTIASEFAASPPPFLHLFRNPPAEQIRYSTNQSAEGGRFYQDQSQRILLELNHDAQIECPPSYCWMTLGQIMNLMLSSSFINDELRELIASLDFSLKSES